MPATCASCLQPALLPARCSAGILPASNHPACLASPPKVAMPDTDAPWFKLKVEIDPAIEDVKNQEITISGKDPAAMLARVEARLRGEGSEGNA